MNTTVHSVSSPSFIIYMHSEPSGGYLYNRDSPAILTYNFWRDSISYRLTLPLNLDITYT